MRQKKITDLSSSASPEKIDLSSKNLSPETSKFFYKKPDQKQKLSDLSGKQKIHQPQDTAKHTPPKYLSDLIRIGFFGLIIVIILTSIGAYSSVRNIKQEVETDAKGGIELLSLAAKNLSAKDFTAAIKTFDQARQAFLDAEKKLWFVSADNSIYLADSDLTYAISNLIEGGNHFATAGEHLLKALEEFNKIPLYFVTENKPTLAIKKGLAETEKALTEINLAAERIDRINPALLPQRVAQPVSLLKQNLARTQTNLEGISAHFPEILKLLGDGAPHRYMILFQNNDELRATGGFIGSYALFQIRDAKIQNLTVHDVYDLQSNQNNTAAPEELKGLFDKLLFRDANYSPDFQISAEKLYEMYRKEGGQEIDTIIAINQGLLPDLLNITGPVQVGELTQFTAANYNLLLTYIIESKLSGDKDPKQILKLFVPEFQKALLKEQNLSKIAFKLYRAVEQKHILLYSRDEKIQSLFDFLNLSGRVRTSENEDYLQIIHSSIATKTDKFIEEIIDHKTEITKSGEIINELTLTRKHTWDDKILTDWQNLLSPSGFNINNIEPHIIDILGRGTNQTSTRIYVPAGSKLLETSDKTLTTHHDKTLNKDYFKIRLNTPRDTTTTLRILYQLPDKLDFDGGLANYKIFVAKQPGSRGSLLNKTMQAPDNYNLLRAYPETATKFNTNLVYDRYFSTIWQK